jgi:hypothetical protein
MKTVNSKSKKTSTAKPAAAPAPVAKAAVAPAPAPAHATAVKATAVKAPATTTTPCREITSECIASRAYSLWEQQGRPQGKDLELWLQAEKQLKSSQSFAA